MSDVPFVSSTPLRVGVVNCDCKETKMSVSLRHDKLPARQVRPGLFRVQWNFEDMENEGIYKKKIKLSGSQSRRSYDITYRFKEGTKDSFSKRGFMYEYKVIVEEIIGESDSDHATPGPVYMWINSNAASGNEISLVQKQNSGRWKRARVTRTPRESLTLWIDFGTSTENEPNVVNEIAKMFLNQTRCDVTFHFSDGQTIGAHVLILSAGSPVFSTLFKPSDTTEKKVEIANITYEIFGDMLIYLYTGKVPKLIEKDDKMVQLLHEAADAFEVEKLKRECIDVLLKRITTENAINLLVWSHLQSTGKLFETTMEFLVSNLRELCYKPQWNKLASDFPDLCVMVTQRIAGPPTITVESDSDE